MNSILYSFSHGDDLYRYYYATFRGIKIWKRVKVLPEPSVFSFNPNGKLWFGSEQQILKFLTL